MLGRTLPRSPPRQEWCTPSCGNRASVARHHERHKKTVVEQHRSETVRAGRVTPVARTLRCL
ncbi:CGNR zinc finger domain-containing protein [Streptomyces dysideae]|uniref:CGNR zinc finger domain-containing protein n=1 Tax=Streptomyces dysideae TaxID=909626 RepID=UPI003899ACEA